MPREAREPAVAREPRPAGPQPGAAELEARRERAALLRAYETSTLTRANFCVLKRISESVLEAQLAQARQEREARGPDARREGRTEGRFETRPETRSETRTEARSGGRSEGRGDPADRRGPRRDAPRAPLPAGERTRPARTAAPAAPAAEAPAAPPAKPSGG